MTPPPNWPNGIGRRSSVITRGPRLVAQPATPLGMSAADRSSTAIDLRIGPRDRPVGAGTVRRLLPHRIRHPVGPFIVADIIGPDMLEPEIRCDRRDLVEVRPHLL